MQQKGITVFEACGEIAADMAKFGLAGIFRGQVPAHPFPPPPPSHRTRPKAPPLRGPLVTPRAVAPASPPASARSAPHPAAVSQGIGIAKAIVSLTLFHEGRMWLTQKLKERNVRNGWVPKQ